MWILGLETNCCLLLGGGFKYQLFSPLLGGEMIQFDKHFFQSGWNWNHQLGPLLLCFLFIYDYILYTHDTSIGLVDLE